MRAILRMLFFLAVCAFTGCSGNQSALDPAATQSRQISGLWWIFFAITSAIFLLVLLAVLFFSFKKPAADPAPILVPNPRGERRRGILIGSLITLTILILFGLLISDFVVGRDLGQLDPNPIQVRLTGHQWWWEVQYRDPDLTKIVKTANVIHVPVGKTVQFELRSVDVIHSFWAPNFHGKKDLVPGHPTTNWFRAEKTGEYRGQCAEFCGLQHAHMRFVVIAEPPEKFEAWLGSQRQSGASPTTDLEKRGQELFVSTTCVMCHTVEGTAARATIGPNLTHVGSRPLIAAATLPNDAAHLQHWILNAQQIKPGAQMPQQTFSSNDVRALTAYLQALK
jgi:cytochrome c oxidase subunit II